MENRRMWIVNVDTDIKLEQISMELCSMLSPQHKMAGMLILEEVLTNIQKYAYTDTDTEKDTVALIFFSDYNQFPALSFMDYGKPFNPTTYIPSKPDGTTIGGHGIRIIKEYCREIKYRRTEDGANILQIIL